MQEVYIAGIGMTKFGKDPRSLAAILSEAAEIAFGDAQVREVDALYIGAMNPEEFTGDANLASQVADARGLTGIPADLQGSSEYRARVGAAMVTRAWAGAVREATTTEAIHA